MRRREEERHASDTEVALTVLCALERVNLWVRVDIIAALNVHNHQLTSRAVKGEAREGVRRKTMLVAFRVPIDESAVRVVLDEGALFLHGTLDCKNHRLAVPIDLHHESLQKVDALWRRERIV